MTNIEFWDLVNKSYKYAGMNNDKYLEILNKNLAKLDTDERYQFSFYVGFYANKAEENPKLALLMKVVEGSVSDDSLFYFALWLVSRGEEVYFETLKDPEKFITLINPKELLILGDHYYAPEFELLMHAGRSAEEYDVTGEISDQEYDLINRLYKERIPADERNYYDLVREIDEILPKTMEFFQFDKELLEESFEYEKIENENFLKIQNEEEIFINKLKSQWDNIELKTTIYNIERPKRNNPIVVVMPPYNDSIMMYTTGLNKNKDGFIVKKCYWYNYKTRENKDIINTDNGRYLCGDEENIYFYRRNFEEQAQLSIYNFESNSFFLIDIIDNDIDNKKIADIIPIIGNGKDKSAVIHDGKLYFSLIIYGNSRVSHTFEFFKEKSYIYDIKNREISLLGENISNIRFYDDKMYYMELEEHLNDYTYYNSLKTLICKDLKKNEKIKIAKNITNYSIDNGIIYYSYPKGERIYDLVRMENETIQVILKDQKYLDNFTAVGDNLFLSFYISKGSGGYLHSFILNIKNGTICEVPKSDQIFETIIYEDKYIAIENVYDDRKVLSKVYEIELK